MASSDVPRSCACEKALKVFQWYRACFIPIVPTKHITIFTATCFQCRDDFSEWFHGLISLKALAKPSGVMLLSSLVRSLFPPSFAHIQDPRLPPRSNMIGSIAFGQGFLALPHISVFFV